MPVLPASVRLALWVTDAVARGRDLDAAVADALPDVDGVDDSLHAVVAWIELGERALLCALPSPGHSGAFVRGEALGPATAAGECLLAPSLGMALVPEVREHAYAASAPAADRVTVFRGEVVGADPVPRHRVEALDARAAARRLQEVIAQTTLDLERLGGAPFAGADLGPGRSRRWALPPSLGPRLTGPLVSAASVGDLARAGLDGRHDGPDLQTLTAREAALRHLRVEADLALEECTNAAVAALAGWVPRTNLC